MVITLSLINFLEEYLTLKRTLTKLICVVLEMCLRRSDFFQDSFTKCVHIRKFLDIQGPKLHCGHKSNISLDSDLPKKITLAHNVFEVTELCRPRADILKPSLNRTLVVSQITKI